MLDWMDFDTTPICEDCVQAPYQDGGVQARKEAVAFVNQLKRQFGTHPDVSFSIHENPHDGWQVGEVFYYLSIRAYYPDDNEEATDYVLNIEGNLPEYWDEEARKELGLD